MTDYYSVLDFVTFHGVEIVALIFSFTAFVVSLRNRHENRIIYDIEKIALRTDTLEKIREKLQSGRYAVLNVTTLGTFPNETTVMLLGKIHKK